MRRAVIGAGLAAAAGGLVVIAGLPFGVHWRGLLMLAWALLLGRDLWRIAAGFSHCARIRVEPGGTLLVYDADECCSLATLQPGSIVLGRAAWLRFQDSDGRRHVELLRRKTVQNKDWRRLQVIWRHLGAGR